MTQGLQAVIFPSDTLQLGQGMWGAWPLVPGQILRQLTVPKPGPLGTPSLGPRCLLVSRELLLAPWASTSSLPPPSPHPFGTC